jgi:hypothetical protein
LRYQRSKLISLNRSYPLGIVTAGDAPAGSQQPLNGRDDSCGDKQADDDRGKRGRAGAQQQRLEHGGSKRLRSRLGHP